MREYLSFRKPGGIQMAQHLHRGTAVTAGAQPPAVRKQDDRAVEYRMIIAIDGPAGCGQAARWESGSRRPLRAAPSRHRADLPGRSPRRCSTPGCAPDDRDRAIAAAKALDPARFDEKALKSHAVGEAASIVSAIPEVRGGAAGVFQRDFAATPPGAVLDGRDIGTVIAPDADVKIFVVADPKERARRRAAEMKADGQRVDEAAVLADILRRDERDRSRAVAPLSPRRMRTSSIRRRSTSTLRSPQRSRSSSGRAHARTDRAAPPQAARVVPVIPTS